MAPRDSQAGIRHRPRHKAAGTKASNDIGLLGTPISRRDLEPWRPGRPEPRPAVRTVCRRSSATISAGVRRASASGRWRCNRGPAVRAAGLDKPLQQAALLPLVGRRSRPSVRATEIEEPETINCEQGSLSRSSSSSAPPLCVGARSGSSPLAAKPPRSWHGLRASDG